MLKNTVLQLRHCSSSYAILVNLRSITHKYEHMTGFEGRPISQVCYHRMLSKYPFLLIDLFNGSTSVNNFYTKAEKSIARPTPNDLSRVWRSAPNIRTTKMIDTTNKGYSIPNTYQRIYQIHDREWPTYEKNEVVNKAFLKMILPARDDERSADRGPALPVVRVSFTFHGDVPGSRPGRHMV